MGQKQDDSHKKIEQKDVRSRELVQIGSRRVNAGVQLAHSSPDKEPDAVRHNLIGLALSGGGIRSAALNIGFLKEIFLRRLLPYVDYLSTVSGGGYAGAYLSSAAVAGNSEKNGTDDDTDPAEEETHIYSPSSVTLGPNDLAPETINLSDDPRPEPKVIPDAFLVDRYRRATPEERKREGTQHLKFIHHGSSLLKLFQFANRYLIGGLWIWILMISGLACASSLIALGFRSLDFPWAADRLAAAGFDGDVSRAFFVPVVLFAAWLLIWSLSFATGRGHRRNFLSRIILGLMLITAGVALAALIGTGDVSFGITEAVQQLTTSEFIGDAQTVGRNALIATVIIGLLPYLSPRRLFQSGTDPKNHVERAVFAVASRSLLVGVPFFIIAWFTREDLTAETRRRLPTLSYGHVINWEHPRLSLFHRIEAERSESRPASVQHSPDDIGNDFVMKLLGARNDSQDARAGQWLGKSLENSWAQLSRTDAATPWDALQKVEQLNQEIRGLSGEPVYAEDGDRPAIPVRMLRGIGRAVVDSDKFCDLVECRERRRLLMTELTDCLNHVLRRPDFFKEFEKSISGAKEEKSEKHKDIAGLVEEAQRLATPPPPSSAPFPRNWLHDIVSTNRSILEAWYPGTIRDRETVFAHLVLTTDQEYRSAWFVWSFGVFVVSLLLIDLNATSLHGFYARRLADPWLVGKAQSKSWLRSMVAKEESLRLSQLNTVRKGFPYHLISATRHRLGMRRTGENRHSHFLFSSEYCGSRATTYSRTEDLKVGLIGGRREISVADAVAVSSAAVSPEQQSNPLLWLLLFLGNARLGLWVPNPRQGSAPRGDTWRDRLRQFLWQVDAIIPVSPVRVLTRWLRKDKDAGAHCFVTDGGHLENTGIGELFKRRCRVVVAVDASCDPDFEFVDFSRLARWARLRHGISLLPFPDDIPLEKQFQQIVPHREDDGSPSMDPTSSDTLVDADRALSRSHFIRARIRYGQSTAPDGLLILVKASLTGDEPLDLLRYSKLEAEFPHHSTTDQFYESDRFESYRLLGEHLAESLITQLPDAVHNICEWAQRDDQSVQEHRDGYLLEFQRASVAAARELATYRAEETGEVADLARAELINPELQVTEVVSIVRKYASQLVDDEKLQQVYVDRLQFDQGAEDVRELLEQLLNDPDTSSRERWLEFYRYGLSDERPAAVRRRVVQIIESGQFNVEALEAHRSIKAGVAEKAEVVHE